MFSQEKGAGGLLNERHTSCIVQKILGERLGVGGGLLSPSAYEAFSTTGYRNSVAAHRLACRRKLGGLNVSDEGA